MSSDPNIHEVRMITDLDREVRLAAIVDLASRPSVQVAAALVDALGTEPEFAIRETLTWAVLQMPDLAHPLLVTAARSTHWPRRMQVAHVLSKLGRFADAQVIMPLINDPIEPVANRAYWAAAMTGNPIVLPALVRALGRGDAELRHALSAAFAALGEESIGPLLDVARDAASIAIRVHAADTLAAIGTPHADRASVPLLEIAEESTNPSPVRFAALNAAGQLPADLIDDSLRTLTEDPDRRLADLAARLLRNRAERSLGDPVRRVRERTGADALTARRALMEAAGDVVAAAAQLTPHAPPALMVHGKIAVADGVLLELLSARPETADTARFGALAAQLAEHASRGQEDDPDLAREVQRLASASVDTIAVGRIVQLPDSTLGAVDLECRTGALVRLDGGTVELRDQIGPVVAAQVLAEAPTWLALADVPPAQLTALGQPERVDLTDREHRSATIRALHGSVLSEQVSVVNPGITVGEFFRGRQVTATGIARLELNGAMSTVQS